MIVGPGLLGPAALSVRPRDVFEGREPENPPALGGVVDVMLEHARLLAAWLGTRPAAR